METLPVNKSSFKLDPKSDRYRICPNCEKPHMVRHRGRDFCSDKCADDYYNTQRRLQKQALHSPDEEINESVIKNILSPLEKNIAILNGLTIDLMKGTYYYISDLLELGYDFTAYTGLYTLHNLPSIYQCRYTQTGPYRLYRITDKLMLIAKK